MEASLIVIIPLGLVLVAGYLHLYRRRQHLRRDEQLVMSRARQKAMHIVATARDQALQIIGGAKISANEAESKLKDNLDEISADQSREFQKLLTNISKSIEVDALKEVEDFRHALELETIQSQAAVAEKIAKEQNEIEIEIERQKRRRLGELETQIQAVLAEVIKRITGRAIPTAEHEELIIKALEDAKRRHFI